jgi:O-antigen/teichoic acid export membrane protein
MTRLTKNIIYNVVGQGLILVVSLIAVRFIFRRLGDDVFGIIFFNLTLTAVLSRVLELGVSTTIVREVSSAIESEVTYIRDLVRTASLVYWAVGLALIAVIWVSAPWLVTHWVNLKTIDPGTAATLLRILSVPALVALPRALYISLFRGRQQMGLTNAIDVGTALAQQTGILLILVAGGSAYMVAAWISGSAALGIIAYIIASGRLVGWSPLVPYFSSYAARRNLAFTGRMSVTTGAALLNSQAAQVIVSKLLPIGEFGFYGFVASTVNRATFIAGAVATAAFPSFSNLHRAGNHGALLIQYRKLQDLICYGTVPLFGGVCFAALPVYAYVFNIQVAWLLLVPTALLCLGTYMNGTTVIPYTLSIAVGRPDIGLRSNVLALVIVVPIAAVLIFNFGLVGAGASWILHHLFLYAYMVPRICKECLQIPSREWFAHVAKVLAASAVTYGIAWIAIVIPTGYSLAGCVIGYIVATIAFGAAALFLIGPDLRSTIRSLTATMRPAGSSPSR